MIHYLKLEDNINLSDSGFGVPYRIVKIELRRPRNLLTSERRIVIDSPLGHTNEAIPLNAYEITLKVVPGQTEVRIEDYVHGDLDVQNGYSL